MGGNVIEGQPKITSMSEEIFQSINDGLFYIDNKWCFEFINNRAANNMGFEPDELLHLNIWDKFQHIKGTIIENNFRQAMFERESIHFELPGILKDRHYQYLVYPALSGILVYMIDITERKKVEEELRRQSSLNTAIIEHMTDGLFLLDKDNNLTILNQGGKDFFHQPQNIYKKGDSFIHTKYYDVDGNQLTVEEMVGSRALRGEKIQSSRVKAERPDKTVYFSLSGSPIYDNEGKITSAIVCCRDITEQVLRENMIFQKKEQLEILFESLTDGLYISDKNGNLVMINEEGRRQLYQADSVKKLGQARNTTKYFDLQGNEITKDRMPGIRAMMGEKVRCEKMLLMRPDIEMYISTSAIPIYDDKGNIDLIAVFSSDITEEINMQKSNDEKQIALLSAERAKNEALESSINMKDEFLATITHEFKTPLSVINAALQTIETTHGSQLSDKVNKHLHKIKKNYFRQLRLVNNLLDVTSYNSGHLKVQRHNLDIVYLTKNITNSVDLYAIQKGIELNFSSDIDHLEMTLDEEKLERILLNILSNAIKFTPKDKSIYVHLASKNQMVFITVRDEGIGIPKSKQEIIFERFGQVDSSLSRRAEGTGIGLSLAKTLISVMNGTITVDSEDNKGSTFTITLPITELDSEMSDAKMDDSKDARIIQAVAIEFSDHYL